MFYLVITNLGNEQCVAQSNTNSFTNGMTIDCSQDLGFPPGAHPVGSITVNCLGSSGAPLRAIIFQ